MTDTAPDPTTLITEEMVEETARAMCDEDEGAPGYYDNELSESWREAWRAKARTVLCAIIPDIIKAEREACIEVALGCMRNGRTLPEEIEAAIRARGAL